MSSAPEAMQPPPVQTRKWVLTSAIVVSLALSS
jgi:hypothetical protein